MNPTIQGLLEVDKLPSLISELALYPYEKWQNQCVGKTESVHGHNQVLWEVVGEISEQRWLKETTVYLFGKAERLKQLSKAGSSTNSEFAYVPIPGLKNGQRIKHPCEIHNKLGIKSILTEAPGNRSRELAWLIPYRTSLRETNLLFIFTFDPILEIAVRTINTEWEKCTKYWQQTLRDQGMIKPGETASCLHAYTGLHEWFNIIRTSDGDETPQSWKRHPISPHETNCAANAGLDLYYSNSVVCYAWSTLQKQKGRERARLALQQDLCKKVILFDPIYGRTPGLKSQRKDKPIEVLNPGDSETEKTAKSFWDTTILAATESGASDIHIEPTQIVGSKNCDLIVSLRKDGQLNFYTKIPSSIANDFARFALETSGVIRDENRVPQDGRRSWTNPKTGESIDLRISVTPCGTPIQKIVMRLLDTNRLKRGIVDLGLEPSEVMIWEKALKLNQSLVLVSGPTNSGKSLRGNTQIRTNKGLISLKEIVSRHESGERFMTWNEKGWEPITNVHHCGIKEVIDITTESGTKLQAAGTHPFLTTKSNLTMVWEKTSDLSVGDTLVFYGKPPITPKGNWEKYWLLGAWVGDGKPLTKKIKAASKLDLDCTTLLASFLSKKIAEEKSNRKNLPKALWTATPYEIAGFFSGWIDTNGSCKTRSIKLVVKEKEMAKEAKSILASVGIRTYLSKQEAKKTLYRKTSYWRLHIRGTRNLQRLRQLGLCPVTSPKRAAFQKCLKKTVKEDKVSFPIKNLGILQNNIIAVIEKVYGAEPKGSKKKYLKLGKASKKSIGLNSLQELFQLFPKALPLLPDIEKILENDLEPEIIQSITRTGKYEPMYDIEVGQNHTYQVEGLICHNSTTLYAAMLTIFQRDNRRSFATIEDPVEYRLPFRATQSPVNEEKGATYERLIRQAMRNDGDTFLIGEIRDAATAAASLQLALTGHQVLSSIHSNSATETALRLLEFGVDPYILSETLKMVVAQKLIPTVCEHCKRDVQENEVRALLRKHGGEILLETADSTWARKYRDHARWIEGEGCTQCNFTGLSGMLAAQEFLVIDRKNRGALKEGNMEILEASMKERSLPTMEETVWRLAWLGKVPLSQAGEVTNQLKSG